MALQFLRGLTVAVLLLGALASSSSLMAIFGDSGPVLIQAKLNVDKVKTKQALRTERFMMAGVPAIKVAGSNHREVQEELEQPRRWVISMRLGITNEEQHSFCSDVNGTCLAEGHPSQQGFGFVTVSASELAVRSLLADHPGATLVEEDMPIYAIPEIDSPFQAAAVPWGLDRIDDLSAGGDGTYSPGVTGAGAHVYVLDTGIRTTHQDFQGRAIPTLDCLGTCVECSPGDTDCARDDDGHGTHCAGTVAGSVYGVAKEATVHAVRVLGPTGGYTSWIVEAIDWVAANAPKPAVISMSLGGPGVRSTFRNAIDAALAAGVVSVIAAGNENSDACLTSPAFVPSAITVGATDFSDTRAYFSNYGSCLDIFAPGVSVRSASHLSDSGSTSMSGTSMACPHVAGAAALLLSSDPSMSAATVASALKSHALSTVSNRRGSVNKMLYVGGIRPSPSPSPLPSPMPAPSPTPQPSPSPSPESYSFVVTGDCVAEPSTGCASSANYPNVYGANQECKLTPSSSGGKLHIVAFDTESGYDKLHVQGSAYSGGIERVADLEGMTLTQDITWTSDYNQQRTGWKICIVDSGIATTTTTTTTFEGSLYSFTVTGDCVAEPSTGCASSANYPNVYGANQECKLTPSPSGGKLHMVAFDTESGYDKLHVQGSAYSGGMERVADLEGMTLTQDIIWTSDYNQQRTGWKICIVDSGIATTATTTTTTTTTSMTITTTTTTTTTTIEMTTRTTTSEVDATTATPVSTTSTSTMSTLKPTFQVFSGPCTIDVAGCVMSPHFPEVYGNLEHCLISAAFGKLVVKAFKTERFDVLSVNGHNYSGTVDELSGLNGMPVTGNITWNSDESVGKRGWRLCLEPN